MYFFNNVTFLSCRLAAVLEQSLELFSSYYTALAMEKMLKILMMSPIQLRFHFDY